MATNKDLEARKKMYLLKKIKKLHQLLPTIKEYNQLIQ